MATVANHDTTIGSGAAPATRGRATPRLTSIDALRGMVMVVMLLDHVRETCFLHMQVGDPMDARSVMPALFFTRLTSMICAPVFVALTGLSAWLYGQKHSRAEVSLFLVQRGAFLMLLELFFVGAAWSGRIVPQTFWLQVIWAIGLCMIMLAALIHLPRRVLVVLGFVIVCGHNLLDPIRLTPADPLYIPWAMLHQREAFALAGFTIKTTYPVLPWIGVMVLGWCIGPWFVRDAGERQRWLTLTGFAMLVGFVVLRTLNVYGDRPWFVVEGDPLRTVMSFLALTKYPPSLLFLLPTLGIGAILLARFERLPDGRVSRWLVVLGGAPMFFYLLHLYVLKALYLIAVALWGTDKGAVFGVDHLSTMYLLYLALIVPLYLPTRWFSDLKKRRKDIGWLKYL
ncbi:MAG: heparan-alpha-glucosaminide N-acetyltransferase domain-containing protein [Sphingomonas fennica]